MPSFQIALALVLLTSAAVSAQVLPQLNIDRDFISVSGFSSGGYFATQFHAAYSATISRVASWCGGPNLCQIDPYCSSDPALIDVDWLVLETERMAANGDIDPTINMRNAQVYVFQGTLDPVAETAPKFRDYFNHYMADPASQLVLRNEIPAGHAVVSDRYGTLCGVTDDFLCVENCGYDRQDEFFDGGANASNLGPQGLVFIPPTCENLSLCKLHVHFHGCEMWVGNVGTDFVRTSGMLDTAEVNDIVILFPQLTSTTFGSQRGCWNWYGYLDDWEDWGFAKKDARQMRGSFRMIQRVAGFEDE